MVAGSPAHHTYPTNGAASLKAAPFFVPGARGRQGEEAKGVVPIERLTPQRAIKVRRVALGLTQVGIAQALGVSQPRISELEGGAGLRPTAKRVRPRGR